MYYTNVDLYANLRQLHGLCRQEFYKCSPGPVPHSCRWWQGQSVAGWWGLAPASHPLQSRLGGGGGRGWRGIPAQSEPQPLSPTSRSLSSLACEPQDPASWGRTQMASGSARDVGLRIQLLPPWDQQSPTIFPGSHPGLEGDARSQKPIESQTY